MVETDLDRKRRAGDGQDKVGSVMQGRKLGNDMVEGNGQLTNAGLVLNERGEIPNNDNGALVSKFFWRRQLHLEFG